jgi:hypothetical protein
MEITGKSNTTYLPAFSFWRNTHFVRESPIRENGRITLSLAGDQGLKQEVLAH